MRHRFFGPQEVLGKDLLIGLIDVAFVNLQKPFFARNIQRWQLVPSHLRMHVMHRVKVVVQKQECQHTPVFDDDRPARRFVMRAVLQKGAYLQQRQPLA